MQIPPLPSTTTYATTPSKSRAIFNQVNPPSLLPLFSIYLSYIPLRTAADSFVVAAAAAAAAVAAAFSRLSQEAALPTTTAANFGTTQSSAKKMAICYT